MRLCIFSDIHGNGPAFRAAFPLICDVAADKNIFLGDLCGYYFDQLEIFKSLQSLPRLIAVRGNHDQMFLDILAGDESLRQNYLREYGSTMENLLNSKNADLAGWLSSLPLRINLSEEGISCVHGSPENELEGYLYPDAAMETLSATGKYLFTGHTHYRMHRFLDKRQVINSGSLGQPRDGDWPSFLVVETGTGEVRFVSVLYDRDEIKEDLRNRNVGNGYLYEILDRIKE